MGCGLDAMPRGGGYGVDWGFGLASLGAWVVHKQGVSAAQAACPGWGGGSSLTCE